MLLHDAMRCDTPSGNATRPPFPLLLYVPCEGLAHFPNLSTQKAGLDDGLMSRYATLPFPSLPCPAFLSHPTEQPPQTPRSSLVVTTVQETRYRPFILPPSQDVSDARATSLDSPIHRSVDYTVAATSVWTRRGAIVGRCLRRTGRFLRRQGGGWCTPFSGRLRDTCPAWEVSFSCACGGGVRFLRF